MRSEVKTMLSQRRSRHPALVVRARQQRRSASPAIRLLWSALRAEQLGAHFRRQHPAGQVIFDFYCPQCRLAIMIAHHEPEGRPSGYQHLRFTPEEVLQELPRVLGRITQALKTV